jgi:hypothetical protein
VIRIVGLHDKYPSASVVTSLVLSNPGIGESTCGCSRVGLVGCDSGQKLDVALEATTSTDNVVLVMHDGDAITRNWCSSAASSNGQTVYVTIREVMVLDDEHRGMARACSDAISIVECTCLLSRTNDVDERLENSDIRVQKAVGSGAKIPEVAIVLDRREHAILGVVVGNEKGVRAPHIELHRIQITS